MNNDSILQKILVWIKDNTIWTILGVILAAIPVIWTAIDRAKKPEMDIAISGHSLTNAPKCDIYYLVPREYVESGTKGSLLLEVLNLGKVDLKNVYASMKTHSAFSTEQSMTLASGKAQTVKNHVLRFRRFVEHGHADNIMGERIVVSYSGDEEELTAHFSTIQRGLAKRIQPVFTIDREKEKKSDAIAAAYNLGNSGFAKIFDGFEFDLDYAATGLSAKSISGIDVIVAEDHSMEELIANYEKEGTLVSGGMFGEEEYESGKGRCVLLYPKYFVEDGVVADVE